jgi:hypothetical protein
MTSMDFNSRGSSSVKNSDARAQCLRPQALQRTSADTGQSDLRGRLPLIHSRDGRDDLVTVYTPRVDAWYPRHTG